MRKELLVRTTFRTIVVGVIATVFFMAIGIMNANAVEQKIEVEQVSKEPVLEAPCVSNGIDDSYWLLISELEKQKKECEERKKLGKFFSDEEVVKMLTRLEKFLH